MSNIFLSILLSYILINVSSLVYALRSKAHLLRNMYIRRRKKLKLQLTMNTFKKETFPMMK